MVAIKRKIKHIPRDAMVIGKLNNGDIAYAINFIFDGKDFYHVNHVDHKGKVKHNIIYYGRYEKGE